MKTITAQKPWEELLGISKIKVCAEEQWLLLEQIGE